jgi:hypothetical protein
MRKYHFLRSATVFAPLLLSLLFFSASARAAGETSLIGIGPDRLTIQASPGRAYQLQSTASLLASAWENTGPALTVPAAGPLFWTLTPTNATRFFRVEIREAGEGLSLAEAEAKVVAEVIQVSAPTQLLLGLRWPSEIPAGAIVQPLSNPDDAPRQWTIPSASFLFLLDHAPAQKLGHPFTYVFVDKVSGGVTTVRAFSPPVVDGISHFSTLRERWQADARFFPPGFTANTPPLAASIALEFPPDSEEPAPASASRNGLLQAQADAGENPGTARLTVNCTNVIGKKVAVVIASGADDEIQNDAREMSALLGRLGFTVTDLNSKSNSLSAVITALRAAGQNLGPCDKFFVYLSSHTQLVDDNDDGKPDQTPTRLDYGLGHTNKTQWAWLPGRASTLPTILQESRAGRLNLMMDTCYSEALAVLMRKSNTQPPPGCEWNIFASSSPTNTSAGATELTLLLDYGNNESFSAYTGGILGELQEAETAGTIDKNGDGQLSIDEIEETFLNGHFAVEDDLKDAQKPHFDRFVGAIPVANGDTFTAPPGVATTNKTALNDTVPAGTQFVIVTPPALHSDLYSWNPQTGEIIVTGLSTISEVTFTYKLAAGAWETPPVTVTVRFDARMNYAEEFLTAGPGRVRVPCLVLDGLHYPVYQFRFTNNPADVCQEPHWHSLGEVFPIDVLSPTGRRDPHPPGCGFGTVQQIPVQYYEVSSDTWQDFLIDHIPPIP